MNPISQQFIDFAVRSQILRFGQFVTKAGRTSPYFFNAGLFNRGQLLADLGDFYAQTILDSTLSFDMIFGPAYKGIPLVASTAMALAEHGRDVAFAFNRKENKDHGEGGNIIGAPLQGKVLIIDDVISAGLSIAESIDLIRTAKAEPAGVVIALDRMERGANDQESCLSALSQVKMQHQIPVIAIANLEDLLSYIQCSTNQQIQQYQAAIQEYREHYGATT